MSVGYLLDTNMVSEVRKRNGDPRVKEWIEASLGPTLHLSTVSLGEIRCGIELRRRRDPEQAMILERWLARLYASFHDRIVPVTSDIAEEWGRLNTTRPLPTAGGLLAATAKVHGWSVVTRNVKDFAETGVTVVNPFAWPV
ncbi:type II toxin-antitoxin system VapC family toxin [Nonomuraea sp. NPDC005501]|uniref:type II toxin-antitoxin system VapC family toxin n=1 Tax=Nonomuraea sp. NPDC005501 TaxID=3156884 RepID=UPI0033B91522